MSILEIESKVKEFFNFNGCEVQLKHLKEVFTNIIKISNNDWKYFIQHLFYE